MCVVILVEMADGILLVHDLANSVSRRNLDKWRDEWTQVHPGNPTFLSCLKANLLRKCSNITSKKQLCRGQVGECACV